MDVMDKCAMVSAHRDTPPMCDGKDLHGCKKRLSGGKASSIRLQFVGAATRGIGRDRVIGLAYFKQSQKRAAGWQRDQRRK
jgi:hypothetical protein